MLSDETLQSQNDKLEVLISKVFCHEHKLILLVLNEGLQLKVSLSRLLAGVDLDDLDVALILLKVDVQ